MNEEISFSKKIILFIVGAIIAVLIMLGGLAIDNNLRTTEIFVNISKIILAACSILIIKLKNKDYKIGCTYNKYFTKYLWLILLLVFIEFICNYGPINQRIIQTSDILVFVEILTTAIWEELYFRGVGTFLFKDKNGNLNKKSIITLILVFALVHMLNAVVTPEMILNEILRTFVALGLGTLLLAVYVKTGNILVPITMHFFNNCTSGFFSSFSSESGYLGNYINVLTHIIGSIICLIIGIKLLKNRR